VNFDDPETIYAEIARKLSRLIVLNHPHLKARVMENDFLIAKDRRVIYQLMTDHGKTAEEILAVGRWAAKDKGRGEFRGWRVWFTSVSLLTKECPSSELLYIDHLLSKMPRSAARAGTAPAGPLSTEESYARDEELRRRLARGMKEAGNG